MQELLLQMVQALVDTPEAVRIEETREERRVCFRVSVAPNEQGQLIGKEGRNIAAVRRLMSVLGQRSKEQISVEVVSREED